MVSVMERPTTSDTTSKESVTSTPPSPRLTAKQNDRLRTRTLFARYRDSGSVALRDELIPLHPGVVRYVAASLPSRGKSFEDLYQVGCHRTPEGCGWFRPDRGFEFLTFAIPTISGEIRRYFQDL